MRTASTRLDEAQEAARKRELRAFLMSRRARLKPGDVGLPETRRRRTPGLRREEVAALAGLSTAWYTLFEMAKESRVSRTTLDGIARALKLSPAETRHLWVLANVPGPVLTGDAPPALDPVLLHVLDGFSTGPAFVLSGRGDVLAMNALAIAIFGDLRDAPGNERNWLWALFTGRIAVENPGETARVLAPMFRATYCEHAGEPAYAELLEALLQASETFARCWDEHDVQPPPEDQTFVVDHPAFGLLRFAFRALPLAPESQARLCFFVPDAATAQNAAYGRLVAAGTSGV